MPSQDFAQMTDQELADSVAYLEQLPPVDRITPRSTHGPIVMLLLATHMLTLAVDQIPDHFVQHRAAVSEDTPSRELGARMAGVCRGCHGAALAGGKILLGHPGWPIAANLTPHPQGLAGWQYADFERAMRRGVRPDGRPLREPMTLMTPYTTQLTDREVQALWLYLSSLPARRTGA